MQVMGEGITSPTVAKLVETLSGRRVENSFQLARHVTYPEEGIELTIDNTNRLVGVHLFSAGMDGKSEYRRGAPFGVTFEDRHDEVLKKCLRPPDKEGVETVWQGKHIPPWDLYLFPKVSLHFQYSRIDGKVELITIMLTGAFGSTTI